MKILLLLFLGLFIFGCSHEVEEKKPSEDIQICAQVITYGENPETFVCEEFPNPCVVPQGWEICENEITADAVRNRTYIVKHVAIGESFTD